MDGKKRIMFVVEVMGGVFTYIVALANGLVNKYDIYIVYATRTQTPSDYKDYFDKRIHLVEMKNFTISAESLRDIKTLFEIKKIAEDVNPDIFNLHSSKACVLRCLAFKGKKTPLFYTPYGYSFLMKNYCAMKRFVYKMIETVSAKRLCTTIGCNEGEHQETLKLIRRATYVDNGINIDLLDNILFTLKPEVKHPFALFTLVRICYQKNSILFNSIAEAMPEIRFMWIGDVELKEELSSSNLEIIGWLDMKNALFKFVSADVFLLTTLWEGLPISFLETMYMKKLYVVNDVIGNHDIIRSGENSYVCNAKSDFVDAIDNIQFGKSAEYLDAADEYILIKNNTVVMVEKYSAIYDEALGVIEGIFLLSMFIICTVVPDSCCA